MVREGGWGKVVRGREYDNHYISQLGDTFSQGMQEILTISTFILSITYNRGIAENTGETTFMPMMALDR